MQNYYYPEEPSAFQMPAETNKKKIYWCQTNIKPGFLDKLRFLNAPTSLQILVSPTSFSPMGNAQAQSNIISCMRH